MLKWDFAKVNLVKSETLKIVNFVKNEALEMWILSKMRIWKGESCQWWGFQNVVFFGKLRIFAPV